MSQKLVSVGLLGCGWISELVHIPNLKARADVRVAAVADQSEDRRNLAARSFAGAKSYPTAQALFDDADVAAIIVAVPPAANRALAEGAFAAGKHVYLEKPLAVDVESAEAIVSAWRRSGRVGMLGYNFRFNTGVAHARATVQSGALGRVLALQSRFTWAARAVDNWRADAAEGGGVLLDLASHHIDLFNAITGDEVVRVSARERSVSHRADTVDITLEGRQGAIHHLHASLAGGANTNRLAVLCESGQIDVDLQDPLPPRTLRSDRHLARQARMQNALGHLHPARLLSAPGYEPSFSKALDAFFDACRTGVHPAPDLSAGLHVMQVVDAARKSSRRLGDPVAVVREVSAGPALRHQGSM